MGGGEPREPGVAAASLHHRLTDRDQAPSSTVSSRARSEARHRWPGNDDNSYYRVQLDTSGTRVRTGKTPSRAHSEPRAQLKVTYRGKSSSGAAIALRLQLDVRRLDSHRRPRRRNVGATGLGSHRPARWPICQRHVGRGDVRVRVRGTPMDAAVLHARRASGRHAAALIRSMRRRGRGFRRRLG
jgi:hypothetical protein